MPCNWRWIRPQATPHPRSNPHLIPLSKSGSSGRPISHGGTVGRSEVELLPSKQVPRFFPLPPAPPGKKEQNYTFGGNNQHLFCQRSISTTEILQNTKIFKYLNLKNVFLHFTLWTVRCWKKKRKIKLKQNLSYLDNFYQTKKTFVSAILTASNHLKNKKGKNRFCFSSVGEKVIKTTKH